MEMEDFKWALNRRGNKKLYRKSELRIFSPEFAAKPSKREAFFGGLFIDSASNADQRQRCQYDGAEVMTQTRHTGRENRCKSLSFPISTFSFPSHSFCEILSMRDYIFPRKTSSFCLNLQWLD